MDNLQEAIEKMKLAQSILTERITLLNEKSRALHSVGLTPVAQMIDGTNAELDFLVNDLGKAIHLAITHNIKN